MKKKVLSALLCAAMVGTMLAGCGGSGNSDSGSTAATADSKVSDDTLVYWSMWEATEPQGIAIKEAVDAYTEDTGVKVDVQFKGRTGQREGLQAALDAGTHIDLFDEDIDRVNGSWGDYTMDLEEYAKAADYEATANAGLMQACRDAAKKDGEETGTLKSIPYQPNVFAFFYNKDLFEQAGIKEEPKTWDEFLAVCQKLKDAGITPITCDDAYADCMIGYHMGRLAGEDKVKEIVKDGKWDDPVVLQMAQDYQALAEKGYFSENIGSNVWPAGQNSELALGEVAMYLNGSWLPNEVADTAGEDFNWGCFSYPAVTEGATDTATGIDAANYGAQVFAINKDSKLGQEAFDLICKITKGEYDEKLATESNGIPADTSNTEWPELVQSVKPVMESCAVRYSWAVGIESNDDMTPVIKENFIKLMAGTIDAQGFVDAMTAASK
ncbi:ABC transporter substrate-binding protein [Hespellia stercorisuis]|uniref:Raffinose/stachyose/melibiose transport system substrate-binding protein n=1 Tax=Hespellia stercorisuis DSM 15480 TaxID=1121950 RepID=A0A1M6HSD9_9FIRM|nr:ABC transporter substrate-binding protein [Hespellia stercorisuis]SHJ25111.1 raffinose/stachyose/melibiose transport system substrate-binding protein [Hespellia stercorisuis DSM 15480]